MNRSRRTRRLSNNPLARFGRWCAALLLLAGASVVVADQTLYHITALAGPATDTDGDYTLTSYVIPLDVYAYGDVVLGLGVTETGVTTPLLNWTNVPISVTSNGVPVSVTGKGAGTYTYTMYAGIYGAYSGYQMTTDTFSVTVTIPTPPPPVPSSISVSPTSTDSGNHTASWSSSSGATKYILEQKKDSGGWVQKYSGASTSQALSGLTIGSYTYRVKACKTTNGSDSCSGYKTSSAANIVALPAPSGSGVLAAPASDPDGSYAVFWSTFTNATRYELQRQVNSGSWVTVQNTSVAIWHESNLGDGRYSYRVRACNATGCADYTSVKTTNVVIAPGTPSSISVSPTTSYNGSHTVSWEASSGSVTEYRLSQRIVDRGSFVQVYAGTDTSYTLNNQVAGSYVYRVRAYRTIGSVTSDSGVQVGRATVSALPPAGTVGVPDNDNDGSYSVVWGSVTGATYYELQRRVGGGSWTTIQNSSALSRSETGLGNGSYDYRLRSCTAAAECSEYGVIDTIDVAITPGVPPSINVSPPVSPDGNDTVSWGPSSGSAIGYQLYQQRDGGHFTLRYSGSATTFVVSRLAVGRYVYRVRAYERTGRYRSFSGYRTSAAVTRPVAPPAPSVAPPAPVVPANDNDGAYDVTWDGVAGATRYELQRRVGGGSWTTIQNSSALSKSESGLGGGTYDYQLRSCTAVECSAYSPISSTAVTAPAAPAAEVSPHVEPTPSANSAAVLETDSVGTTAGSFRVDESGSATYSIPIATAAGTAGVAPQLSLNYSSQGGNGLMGLGWNIGGLSGISRSRQTLQQDGQAAPITWGAEDRFALDGQRLILVSGTYGDPNSEYRTEIDSFAKIFARGGTSGAGNPDYWEVQRKDGSTSYYGDVPAGAYTDARQSNSAGQVLTWGLKRFDDSVGNPIWFEYEATGGHSIKEVRYAYGSADGPGGYNARVVFNYDSSRRTDEISGYVMGHEFTTSKRLASVDTYNTVSSGEKLLRHYGLSYLDEGNGSQTQPTTDDLSRLDSLKECSDITEQQCLPATDFDWSLPTLGIGGVSSSFSFGVGHDDYVADYRPADINGDGRLDMVWLEASTNRHNNIDRHGLYYTLATTSGGYGSRILAYEDFEFAGSAGGDGGYKIEILDYNADGRMDVMLWDNNDHQSGKNSEWRVHLSTPQVDGSWKLASTGFVISASEDLKPLDINGDGLQDLFDADGTTVTYQLMERNSAMANSSSQAYHFATTGTISWNNPPLLPVESTECGNSGSDGDYEWGVRCEQSSRIVAVNSALDFNGDGRLDAFGYSHREVILDEEGYSFGEYEYSESIEESHYRYYALVEENGEWVEFAFIDGERPSHQFLDVNSDGLTDILSGRRDSRQLHLNNGAGFNTPIDVTIDSSAVWEQRHDVQFVDYNRDGYPDLVWFDHDANYLKVRYWNGSDFDATVNAKYISGTDEEQKKRSYAVMDVNADAIPDLVQFDLKYGTTSTMKTSLSSQQGAPTNRITQITNGLGAETNINYGTLATSGHYQQVNVGTTTTTYVGPCFDYDPYNVNLRGTPGICGYTYTSANTGDFYALLNGEWDVNSGSDTLGKDVNGDGQRDPVLELNGPMYVVTNVASAAPEAGATPDTVNNNATSSISYYYAEAKIQAMGRGFLGFQRLRTVDEQTKVMTTTTYRQDFPFIGLPIKTEVTTEDGHLLSESENIWKLKHWNDSSQSQSDWSGTGLPATKLYAPYLEQSIENTYDLVENTDGSTSQGTHLQTVTTDSTYDGYGNPTLITVTTDDATGNDRFVKATSNTYGSSTWEQEMGRLSRTSVVSTRTDSQGTNNATRTSAFTYYPSGAHKGLLNTEVIEPDNNVYKLTTTYLYDAFGNKLRATTGGAGVTARYSRSEYDSLGRYVERSFNSLEQKTSEVIARNDFGQVTQARDLNGLDVYSAYSAMGRKYFDRSETGGFSKTYLTDADTSNCPANSVYKAISQSAGGGESQQCFDQLGRATRSLAQSFDGRWLASDVEFDNLGRTKRQSEPYYLGQNPTLYWTTIEYDLLGRPTTTTLPDNSTGSVAYNGYSMVTINDLGRRKVETKNALGEVVSVTDNENGLTNEVSSITYAYDPQGNMTTMTDSSSNVSSITYDLLGRKTAMNDPDKGNWSYDYNVYGELTEQTDANGQTGILSYDILGRLTHRIDKRADNSVESDTLWAYNNGTNSATANGLGLLNNVQQDNGDNGTNDYVKTVSYDPFGRVINTATSLGAAGADGDYIEEVTYDQFGRTFQTFDAANDPTGYTGYQGTQSQYNQYGYLEQVGDALNGSDGLPLTVYRKITSMDERGNITSEERSNDLVDVSRVYDAATGRLETIDAVHSFTGADVQDLDYEWDTLGNLNHRKEKSGNKDLTEDFLYDGLNRLTSYHVVGQTAKTVSYNALGNITNKSDVGNYFYGTGNTSAANDAGPHALISITGAEAATYAYDNNGNNTSGDGRTIDYSTFDKPTQITKGGHTTAFQYGPDRARYKRTDTNSSGTKTTLYVGNTEWITKLDGNKEIKRYLGGTIITLKLNSSDQLTGKDTHYQYHDHLGSIDVITDHQGNVVQELSFDAWGERRDAINWTNLNTTELVNFDSSITTRGFTGHEMLDEVGVIHMNGRIYDAKIARFLQADPFVQDPAYSQSLNRYSYTWNNPLNATDPSGFISIKQIVSIVVAVVVSVVTFGAATGWAASWLVGTVLAGNTIAIGAIAGAIAGFAASFSVAALNGSSFSGAFQSGLKGALSGAVFGGIGGSSLGDSARIGAHALAGGVSATSEAWSILQGVSPCRVRPNQPPVSSVAFVAEHRERKCFPVREKLFIFSINERTKQTKRTQRIV